MGAPLTPPITVLREARALISSPEKWCRGSQALDDRGNWVQGYHWKAVRWSAFGAIERIDCMSITWPLACLGDAARELFDRHASEVNDQLKHADVLRMFDRAIELVEAA
ncbi:DUF6197 family protein [Methylobacterium gnaphalii]|uniref:Uncharacterized protein n=1 Tax=Methylobacterium gnaphalii TaxID=1010610 RepID=A0A512JQR7_9HYPH|nr:hypothetical protein [Methylobacterium gnaphalii]GEP12282.1 hypothetical protein MGN01_41270 [Methylobacterium gnaphalii]GJD68714.1 hypothetical protein MMMDOFMJ_1638 [Methylobacterium gnaphalii]GLS49389.1 hypothetical protein GCM10007885_22370 [Methylobacterium gnaphalii]